MTDRWWQEVDAYLTARGRAGLLAAEEPGRTVMTPVRRQAAPEDLRGLRQAWLDSGTPEALAKFRAALNAATSPAELDTLDDPRIVTGPAASLRVWAATVLAAVLMILAVVLPAGPPGVAAWLAGWGLAVLAFSSPRPRPGSVEKPGRHRKGRRP